jgi:hypothetical protein
MANLPSAETNCEYNNSHDGVCTGVTDPVLSIKVLEVDIGVVLAYLGHSSSPKKEQSVSVKFVIDHSSFHLRKYCSVSFSYFKLTTGKICFSTNHLLQLAILLYFHFAPTPDR